jgi:hypothetical protein
MSYVKLDKTPKLWKQTGSHVGSVPFKAVYTRPGNALPRYPSANRRSFPKTKPLPFRIPDDQLIPLTAHTPCEPHLMVQQQLADERTVPIERLPADKVPPV